MDLKREFDVRSKLLFIATNLKIYDKISVIFFLCDKPYAGLKIMEILLATDSRALQNKAFFTWAKKQMLFSSSDWSRPFAEIAAVLQNYRLVSYLGYDKEEFNWNGPMKNNTYLSGVKVVLYKLCERLNQAQTARLIETIDEANNIIESNKTNQQYLEKKLLLWSVKNVINIDGNRKTNLVPIIKFLSSLDSDLLNEMKEVVENDDYRLLKSIKASQTSLPNCYNVINKSDLGLCVIINEKSFPGSSLNLKPRWGSNKDVERLKEVFTAYGFRIKVHTDLNYDTLIDMLNKYAKSVSVKDSFFVLIILSHGSENIIYTSDSIPVSMGAIEMIFQAENCPYLIGKAKIFIIQSCQGQKWQKVLQSIHNENAVEECEISADTPETSLNNEEVTLVGPQKGDSIIAWSTVQGYASFRDKHNGSWYIEELCKELWKFGHVTDLVDILTLVNNNLRSKVYDGQFMVPSLLSSLSGKIQFPYVKENWLRGRGMLFKRLYFEMYFSEFLKKTDISFLDLLKLRQEH